MVGDALHYKDPADGQGIYDALLESKLLAQTILDWKYNGRTWLAAGARYQQQVMDATHTIFGHTINNVKQTLDTNVPPFIAKTVVRWLMNDAGFQYQFLRYLSRAMDPANYKATTAMSAKMLVNGIIRDILKRFAKDLLKA